jgi:hypothetical protein
MAAESAEISHLNGVGPASVWLVDVGCTNCTCGATVSSSITV